MVDFVFDRYAEPSPEAAASAYKQWHDYQAHEQLISVVAVLVFFLIVVVAAVYRRTLWTKARPAMERTLDLLLSHPLALAASLLMGAYTAIKWHLCSADTLWFAITPPSTFPGRYSQRGFDWTIAQSAFCLIQGLFGVCVSAVVFGASLYIDAARVTAVSSRRPLLNGAEG